MILLWPDFKETPFAITQQLNALTSMRLKRVYYVKTYD